MKVVLISTYELGHQPFGIASPAAWLKEAGAAVTCMDLAIEKINRRAIQEASLIACYVPMHTATRIAVSFIDRIRALNPGVHLCFYGLYAPLNEAYLRDLGVETILGGEFESGLVSLYQQLAQARDSTTKTEQPIPTISLDRQKFRLPDRTGLPDFSDYAFLTQTDGSQCVAGYTEASRGCKHLCRHCPIVPVYQGRFRIVQSEVVLADIAQQVEAGVQHITFGDPDFFNGPGHAVPLVKALHARFPDLTYDVTIKVEHLLKHADLLPVLRDTGCLFVTSAVESVDDSVLQLLDKGHTRADFVRLVSLFKSAGLALNPTFVTFHPWLTLAGYLDFLNTMADLDLIHHIAPIQYAIRLLIPTESRLLELPQVRAMVGPFDAQALVYPWRHPDPCVDQLQAEVLNLVEANSELPRQHLFNQIWDLTCEAYTRSEGKPPQIRRPSNGRVATPIPHLSEPWYC